MMGIWRDITGVDSMPDGYTTGDLDDVATIDEITVTMHIDGVHLDHIRNCEILDPDDCARCERIAVIGAASVIQFMRIIANHKRVKRN